MTNRIFNEMARVSSETSSGAPIKVTPSDTVNFPRGRYLAVGTGGVATLVYDNPNGGADILCADFPLPAGYHLLGNLKRINAAGLTAGDIWVIP